MGHSDSSGQNTVILVDDDAAVRDSFRLLLEVRGYRVEEFASAEQCLVSPNTSRASCIVVDFHMPVMTGLALIQALRRRGIQIPAFLISGALSGAIRREAETLDLSGIFEKPSDNGLLLTAIDSACAPGSRIA